ncbi:MAG: 4-hydroxythreonine-4-phosphate dehydrogenase PdxA [Rhodothermales bacterium]
MPIFTSAGRPCIAVTMGDPAGIGPEICLDLLSKPALRDVCRPVVFGSAPLMQRVAEAVGRSVELRSCTLQEWVDGAAPATAANVVDLHVPEAESVVPGQVSATTGRAAYTYITAAIDRALEGRVDAVATGPIHKEALRAAGIDEPGHTEIFAARTDASRSCMMLTSPELTCSFATTHVGYRDVPGLLSRRRILDVIELTDAALTALRGRRPVLAVCGLNPHAGEHGLFGAGEEEDVIIPAISSARDRGIQVDGPLPPDTAFLPARRERTDGFICMYHDQGHIPLKALAFDLAVNVTLGLPIVRTSVDHGTALDIAWQGVASSESLFQAVRLAVQLSRTRRAGV